MQLLPLKRTSLKRIKKQVIKTTVQRLKLELRYKKREAMKLHCIFSRVEEDSLHYYEGRKRTHVVSEEAADLALRPLFL